MRFFSRSIYQNLVVMRFEDSMPAVTGNQPTLYQLASCLLWPVLWMNQRPCFSPTHKYTPPKYSLRNSTSRAYRAKDSQGCRSVRSSDTPKGRVIVTKNWISQDGQCPGLLKSKITKRPPEPRAVTPFLMIWSYSGISVMANVERIPSTRSGNRYMAASCRTRSTFDQEFRRTRLAACSSISGVKSTPISLPSGPIQSTRPPKFKPVPQPISTTVSPRFKLSDRMASLRYANSLKPRR